MDRKIIATAAFFGVTAVILGAFGAHALKEKLDLQQLAIFETGVRYQMYHALFLMLVGVLPTVLPRSKKAIYYFTIAGVLCFSVSLYLLATREITGMNFKPIGIVTPIGGLLLIIAWIILIVDQLKKKSQIRDKENNS